MNLGLIPLDNYTATNTGYAYLSSGSCPSSSTVRSCVQAWLSSYHTQGVTGVRFMFGLGGNAGSKRL
jgi:hypothetical protein